MKTLAYYQRKPETGIGIARHIGFDDNEDYLFSWDLFAEEDEKERGFSIRKIEVRDKWDKIEFDPSTLERTTCGRRLEGFRPDKNVQNRDYWRKETGRGYEACSFCGSARFELFVEVIDAVLADKPGYGIERASGKNYKYYLKTPENSQIKFYTPHIPKEIFADEVKLKELNDKLIPACKKSWGNFMKNVAGNMAPMTDKPKEEEKPEVIIKELPIDPQDIKVLLPGAIYALPTFKVGPLGLERGPDVVITFCKGNKEDESAPRQTGVITETLIALAKMNLEELNVQLPSRENSMIITKLDEALMWTEKRSKDRTKRGVQGTYKK